MCIRDRGDPGLHPEPGDPRGPGPRTAPYAAGASSGRSGRTSSENILPAEMNGVSEVARARIGASATASAPATTPTRMPATPASGVAGVPNDVSGVASGHVTGACVSAGSDATGAPGLTQTWNAVGA